MNVILYCSNGKGILHEHEKYIVRTINFSRSNMIWLYFSFAWVAALRFRSIYIYLHENQGKENPPSYLHTHTYLYIYNVYRLPICLCWWEAFLLHGGTMYELCVTSWHSELVVPTQMRGGYLCDVLQPSVCTVLLCPHVRPLCVPLCASVTFCHYHHVRDETGSRGHRNISEASSFLFSFSELLYKCCVISYLTLTFKTFL